MTAVLKRADEIAVIEKALLAFRISAGAAISPVAAEHAPTFAVFIANALQKERDRLDWIECGAVPMFAALEAIHDLLSEERMSEGAPGEILRLAKEALAEATEPVF